MYRKVAKIVQIPMYVLPSFPFVTILHNHGIALNFPGHPNHNEMLDLEISYVINTLRAASHK